MRTGNGIRQWDFNQKQTSTTIRNKFHRLFLPLFFSFLYLRSSLHDRKIVAILGGPMRACPSNDSVYLRCGSFFYLLYLSLTSRVIERLSDSVRARKRLEIRAETYNILLRLSSTEDYILGVSITIISRVCKFSCAFLFDSSFFNQSYKFFSRQL